MKKALFLDLDGTIRQPIANPNGFISHPFDQEIIAGAKHAIDIYTPSEILFIGDRPEDEESAKAANIPFIWAHEWRSIYLIA
ncbi:MAG: hypothetical protein ACK52I_08960 [Pseudomonadota bacterium]|jgi:histidinol phosphatase-like enzyme